VNVICDQFYDILRGCENGCVESMNGDELIDLGCENDHVEVICFSHADDRYHLCLLLKIMRVSDLLGLRY